MVALPTGRAACVFQYRIRDDVFIKQRIASVREQSQDSGLLAGPFNAEPVDERRPQPRQRASRTDRGDGTQRRTAGGMRLCVARPVIALEKGRPAAFDGKRLQLYFSLPL